MLRYGSGSVPIATGWKCTNCHRTHRSSIPRSASGNTRARPELTTGTSRPLPNWSAPCPGSSERCKTILSRSDPICFLFVDRHVLLIMRGCIAASYIVICALLFWSHDVSSRNARTRSEGRSTSLVAAGLEFRTKPGTVRHDDVPTLPITDHQTVLPLGQVGHYAGAPSTSTTSAIT